MSKLENLSNDKATVMLKLADSQNLCKALYYSEDNFLDMPDIEDTSVLFYDKIFPFKRIPDLATDKNSYITMGFRKYKKTSNHMFKSGYLYLYAITHKDKVRTDHGFLRFDFLISEIDKQLNDFRGTWFGKLEFYEMDEYYIGTDYIGMYISYKIYEEN